MSKTIAYTSLIYAMAALSGSNGGGGGTGTGVSPYTYAQSLGYTGSEEQFNVAYMNAIGLTERPTGNVLIDGGGQRSDPLTLILDGNKD